MSAVRHFMRPAAVSLALLLAALPARAQEEHRPLPPLLVGELSHEGVVLPIAQFVNRAWQPLPAPDSLGLPPFEMPGRWYQFRAAGGPRSLDGGSTVRLLIRSAEVGSYWELGQFVSPDFDSADQTPPMGGSVVVDSLIPGGMFVTDSSRATRARLQPLLERLFADSFAVPDPTRRAAGLRRGRAPLHRVTIQRTTGIRRREPTLLLVEAERCVGPSGPGACSMTLVFDVWLLDDGSEYKVLGKREPLLTDEDFKSGGSSLRARAWLEVDGRCFLVVREATYLFVDTFVAEILPTSVHPISRSLVPSPP